MSIEMMTLVWRHSRNKGSVLLMELAIADHAHDDGKGAYPSVYRLTRYARLSERNVQYLVRKLTASKEVAIIPNGGPKGTNAFEINVRLLNRLPDVIDRGAKIAGGAKIAPVQKKARGVQSSARGVQKRAGGVQKRVKHRVQLVAPEPEPSLEPSYRTVKEPSSSAATRDDTELERIDRNMQLMMMHFGFEPVIAKRIAEQSFCTDEYIRTWIAHAKRDLDWKMAHDQDDKILGPGFYYTHMKDGELPLPLLRAQQQKKRDAAHVGDKAYWEVKRARQLAVRQRNQTRPTVETR